MGRVSTRMFPQMRPNDPAGSVLELQYNGEGAFRFILNGREILSLLTTREASELMRWLAERVTAKAG